MNWRKTIRAIAVRIGLVTGAGLASFFVLEIIFRLFFPQIMLTPRYDYLPEIGIINFPNVKMKHRKPGVFRYIYTVNAERYRGELVPFEGGPDKIVVLGDSFAFGYGVQDDETFSHLLNQKLAGRYQAVNLGNGGWGLTHQIVRYLTFGAKYHPKIVVLQFSKNDPDDNLLTPLVTWDDARSTFALHRVEQQSINRFRRIVAFSKPVYTLLTGYSQTYNFVRNRLYNLVKRKDEQQNVARVRTNATSESAQAAADGATSSKAESYYNDLLEHFSQHLKNSGIRLIMISVQGDLETFPQIKEKVLALHTAGALTYLDTQEWFSLGPDYASPEGHDWGVKAHARIAEGLSQWLLQGIHRNDSQYPSPVMTRGEWRPVATGRASRVWTPSLTF